MIKSIDRLLDRVTMYRLILYYLLVLLGAAGVMSALGMLAFSPISLLFTTAFLFAACWVTNTIFAMTFAAPTNTESVYITALILALIITPITPLKSMPDMYFLLWVSVLAMASKFILAINRKHLFNPAALAVAITALTIDQAATWWVGTLPMLPFVLLGGLLLVRKIRRFGLLFVFLFASLVTIMGFSALQHDNLLTTLQLTFLSSPLLFFGFVILTEPLTTPPTRPLQMIYGAIVGVFFAPQLHFGSLYFTPELAILIGNVFSYLVSPKAKIVLKLKEKVQIAPDIYDFIFTPSKKLAFAPGQYMEWTLGHDYPDSRGNRRYFTLASSPNEDNLRLGVKFYNQSSSYKRSMLAMEKDSEIVAGQLAGDFVLPRGINQKCVLIAGGIGVTPFRSMIQHLLDINQRRDLVIFYINRHEDEIVYKDVFDKARQKLGIKTVYTLTDASQVPPTWKGKVGYVDKRMLRENVPDYGKCLFYVSGPNAMVTSVQDMLLSLGISRDHIKTDFFPGLV
ncbi:MAG: RnfABCDGE type electron transport complex subunit D [Anaerolineae bacterium]|nr:RnfABCDGE type electron transport complex subunit D [Anaerolineae bacterium]